MVFMLMLFFNSTQVFEAAQATLQQATCKYSASNAAFGMAGKLVDNYIDKSWDVPTWLKEQVLETQAEWDGAFDALLLARKAAQQATKDLLANIAEVDEMGTILVSGLPCCCQFI
jgi:hypothetical protein